MMLYVKDLPSDRGDMNLLEYDFLQVKYLNTNESFLLSSLYYRIA